MKLVKFGHRYINFDTVCEITINTEVANIYFNLSIGSFDGGEGKIDQAHIQLYGADVIALQQWLDGHSDNARAPLPLDPNASVERRIDEWAAYQRENDQ